MGDPVSNAVATTAIRSAQPSPPAGKAAVLISLNALRHQDGCYGGGLGSSGMHGQLKKSN
ncbi:hypothetical protein [Sporosarcina sp. Te-1]|uniref:hypothetical protein n=1 Tax=Sporosarcina sp. Te-1 TaxID=2818390 RepID=UPI001A9D7D4C|nr:hypothetical protein [Sporosarcina sp. Te-1]QTD40296.1 hypothetical protein J3U78_16100 [Sporosarcina sp. Te-1]